MRGLWFWIIVPLASAGAGLLYAALATGEGMVGAALRGALIGTPILMYERGFIFSRWRKAIRGRATPVFAVGTIATYTLSIAVSTALAGAVLHALGILVDPLDAMMLSRPGLLYALGVSSLFVFVFRVRDLIGPGVFLNLLLGRYHRPISEQRIFLFLDVTGSTQFAERHGDLAAQDYLGQIFNALAQPVRRYNGAIDDYIGDMALVTWPITRGARDAACLRCVFAFADMLAAEAETWQARFGQVPQFRAALHCGSVVVAEIGFERHKIAYFGDVVNTTGRLEALSKTLGVHVLVSADLLACLGPLPPDFVAEELGTHAVRGRNERLEVAAIRRRDELGAPRTERPGDRHPAPAALGPV